MLNRIILSHTRRQILRSLVRRSHETHVPEKYMKFRTGTYDEIMPPSGDWKEAYNQLQSKYNKQLILSSIYLMATLGYIYTSGVIDLVLPPPYKNE